MLQTKKSTLQDLIERKAARKCDPIPLADPTSYQLERPNSYDPLFGRLMRDSIATDVTYDY